VAVSQTSFTESVIEQAALAWLEGPGYAVLHGLEIAPDAPTVGRFMNMVVLPW